MSSFDPIMRTYIASIFVRLKKERQISTIISTSNLDILSRTCEKILVMDQGNLVEFGTTNEIISNSTNELLVSSSKTTKMSIDTICKKLINDTLKHL